MNFFILLLGVKLRDRLQNEEVRYLLKSKNEITNACRQDTKGRTFKISQSHSPRGERARGNLQ
jgi:hypothetical protein